MFRPSVVHRQAVCIKMRTDEFMLMQLCCQYKVCYIAPSCIVFFRGAPIPCANKFFMVSVNVFGYSEMNLLQDFLLAPRVGCYVFVRFVHPCYG
jgi:hypothetical protein